MGIKDKLKDILVKGLSVEEVLAKSSPEERHELEITLAYMSEMKKANKEFYDYESTADQSNERQATSPKKYQGGDPRHAERGNTRAGNIRPPAISDGSSKLKMPHTGISEKGAKVRNIETFKGEMCKFDNNGQWKIEKAFDDKAYSLTGAASGKPQPKTRTLDYSKDVNPKPDYASIEANAPTLDYSKMTSPEKPKSTPKTKKEVWLKVNAERQNKLNKAGVLVDEEVKNKERLVIKDELQGYGSPGITTPAVPMQMSENEPHHDDPAHEKKEKKRASKIKEEAQKILDMHKDI